MPKFNVEASFSLVTEIEPEGVRFDREIEVDDSSSFYRSDVESDGGALNFTVEAVDEIDAERKATDIIYDGMEVQDDNGFTWSVTNLDLSIERAELSKEQAFVIVRQFLDRMLDRDLIGPEEREAFDVLLQDI